MIFPPVLANLEGLPSILSLRHLRFHSQSKHWLNSVILVKIL
jgi:hypothetical protein